MITSTAPNNLLKHSEPRVSTAKSRLTQVYAYAVFLLVPLFYVLIAILFFQVIEQGWLGIRRFESVSRGWRAVAAVTWGIGLFLAARLACYLWYGIRGLVTPIYDEHVVPPDGIVLLPMRCPALFEAIEEVRQRVGAPAPDVVYVSHRPLCYAAELRWFAISTRRQLVLVLGLPHLISLTVAELKVILAHELAHFAGGDTWLSVFLFRFSASLAKFLARSATRWWRWFDPLYYYSLVYHQLFIVLTAPISRQQEIRADCKSASIYGSELTARTLLKEWQLVNQFDAAVASFVPLPVGCVGGSSERGDPAAGNAENSNVFDWFRFRWQDFSGSGYEYLEQRLAQEETPSFWDSHPTMQKRLEAIRRFPQMAELRSPAAASLLAELAYIKGELHCRLLEEADMDS